MKCFCLKSFCCAMNERDSRNDFVKCSSARSLMSIAFICHRVLWNRCLYEPKKHAQLNRKHFVLVIFFVVLILLSISKPFRCKKDEEIFNEIRIHSLTFLMCGDYLAADAWWLLLFLVFVILNRELPMHGEFFATNFILSAL